MFNDQYYYDLTGLALLTGNVIKTWIFYKPTIFEPINNCQVCIETFVVKGEVHAWQTDRNNKEKTVDWQFTATDARIKLKRLYPKL